MILYANFHNSFPEYFTLEYDETLSIAGWRFELSGERYSQDIAFEPPFSPDRDTLQGLMLENLADSYEAVLSGSWTPGWLT